MARGERAGSDDVPPAVRRGGAFFGCLAIADGLSGAGEHVRLLDEGDDAFRAARSNFGWVWVQGKGLGKPDCARSTMAAAERWPAFAQELAAITGVAVELSQIGGLTMCLDDQELADRAASLESLRQSLGGHCPYQILDAKGLQTMSPLVGPEGVGVVFGPLDGHVSPLRLLRALVQGFESRGGELVAGGRVERIEQRSGTFHVWTGSTEHVAGRVVLAAGLGNRALAPMAGLKTPVKRKRGQILVSERVQPFLRHPSLYVRKRAKAWFRSATRTRMWASTTAPRSKRCLRLHCAPRAALRFWPRSTWCAPVGRTACHEPGRLADLPGIDRRPDAGSGLLNAGVVAFRHPPVSGQERAPLCLMGLCFDCLVELDGAHDVQSCMVEVREGMQLRLHAGARLVGDPA